MLEKKLTKPLYIIPGNHEEEKKLEVICKKFSKINNYHKKTLRINNLVLGSVFNNQSDIFVEQISKKIPLGRMANKDEYNEALLFLCSDRSSYMTGQNLVINGGRGIF